MEPMIELILHCAACALIGTAGGRLINFVRCGRRHHEPRMICVCQTAPRPWPYGPYRSEKPSEATK